jgi:hypothetical protein
MIAGEGVPSIPVSAAIGKVTTRKGLRAIAQPTGIRK